MREKAIVLEVNKKYCTVLTSGGDFRKVRMRGVFSAGQEICLPDNGPGVYRYALAAACLAFFIITAGLWKFWTLPAVAAYVCLDINPSVEMALDRDSVVRGVNPLNEDGENLVAGLDLKGKDVREAVEGLIGAATDKKYILPGEENVVMSSVIPAEDQSGSPEMDLLVKQSIENSLQRKNIQAEVVVVNASPVVREEAGKAGMSTGRYMLYLNARERGADVSPADFKNKSIRIIEKEQKIKISEIEKNTPGHGKGTIREQGRPTGEKSVDSGADSQKPASVQSGGTGKPGGGGWKSGGDKQQGGQDNSGSGSRKDDSGNNQNKGKDASGGNSAGHGDKGNGSNRGGNAKSNGSSGSAVSGDNGGTSGGVSSEHSQGGGGSSDKGSSEHSQGGGGSDKVDSSSQTGSGKDKFNLQVW
ncbi:MAG: anti-sigma factor domain-containing protein [Actinobacteria bacterium]|nr:anti-sigma factor domain-containing protein [Actinomycetota bacterium]